MKHLLTLIFALTATAAPAQDVITILAGIQSRLSSNTSTPIWLANDVAAALAAAEAQAATVQPLVCEDDSEWADEQLLALAVDGLLSTGLYQGKWPELVEDARAIVAAMRAP